MRHIDDVLDVPPSTAPRLDATTIKGLPQWPVMHLTPLRKHDGSAPTLKGVRQLRWCGQLVAPCLWDADIAEFDRSLDAEVFDSMEELCESHDVRYLRLPRLSCALTTAAVRAGTKTVTRRLNGRGIEPGALLNLTDGSRRPGVLVLATVVVTSVETQPLREMPVEDVRLEGFGAWLDEATEHQALCRFYTEFLDAHGLAADENPEVTRIEYRYLSGNQD